MKNCLPILFGCLVFTTTSSSAALLLTFTEESGDVVMRTSGSVDVSLAGFVEDSGPAYFISVEADQNGVLAQDTGFGAYRETSVGLDLLGADLLNGFYGASSISGAGDYIVYNDQFFAFSTGDLGVIADGDKDATVTTSTRVLTFSGQTFASMGLDAHATNTVIDLWGARVGATDDEKVQFIVSSIPEPSSTTLLGLGSLGLLLRRRRG